MRLPLIGGTGPVGLSAGRIALEHGHEVIVADSGKHEPLARRRLRFTANTATFAVYTDDAGRVTFLGKPTLFRIETEDESGMTIVPL